MNITIDAMKQALMLLKRSISQDDIRVANLLREAIAREEVFGPVLVVLTFRTLEEAIALTNDATYGLSAGIWCDDVHTCLEFGRRVQAGTVWTNTWMDGFPEVAFGGVKQSGQGREIGSYGFDEFLEVKSLVMRIGRTRAPWVKLA